MNQQFGPLLYTISVWALPAIIAITFHEAAHGFVDASWGMTPPGDLAASPSIR
jgi:hypothetical protein